MPRKNDKGRPTKHTRRLDSHRFILNKNKDKDESIKEKATDENMNKGGILGDYRGMERS